jgi:hypothetical protein
LNHCPTDLNIEVVVTLIKDAQGDNKSIDNSRGITIGETISSIFEQIILYKMFTQSSIHVSMVSRLTAPGHMLSLRSRKH